MPESFQKGAVGRQARGDEIDAGFYLGPDYQIDCRPSPIDEGVFLEKGRESNNGSDETPVDGVKNISRAPWRSFSSLGNI